MELTLSLVAMQGGAGLDAGHPIGSTSNLIVMSVWGKLARKGLGDNLVFISGNVNPLHLVNLFYYCYKWKDEIQGKSY